MIFAALFTGEVTSKVAVIVSISRQSWLIHVGLGTIFGRSFQICWKYVVITLSAMEIIMFKSDLISRRVGKSYKMLTVKEMYNKFSFKILDFHIACVLIRPWRPVLVH